MKILQAILTTVTPSRIPAQPDKELSMKTLPALCAALAGLAMSGCASGPNMGDAGSRVATGGAQAARPRIERCDRTLGTISIVEETDQPWMPRFTQEYGLQSTVPLLRLIIEQSTCFIIVERAYHNAQAERAGQLRQGGSARKMQMAAADYTATPSMSFGARGSGRESNLAGGLSAPAGPAVASPFSDASTMLLLTDNRSGIELAAAQGSTRKWDVGMLPAIYGASPGTGTGYSNSPQGMVLAASFIDSYNQLVKAVRRHRARIIEMRPDYKGPLNTK